MGLLNKKNYIFKILSFIIVITVIINITGHLIVSAEEVGEGGQKLLDVLNISGEAAGYEVPESDVSGMLDTTIGQIIAVILGFLGVIFFVIIIYSGYQWMTAGGNEETVTKAKKRLTNATIGLIIVISGFVISYFVVTQLSNITNPGMGGGGSP